MDPLLRPEERTGQVLLLQCDQGSCDPGVEAAVQATCVAPAFLQSALLMM